MKYDIEVTVSRPKMKPRVYKTSFNMTYNDDNYVQCENMIRDHLKEIGDKFINDEYYL